MKRRDFLKRTIPAMASVALAPILLSHLETGVVDDAVTNCNDYGYFYCPYIPLMYHGEIKLGDAAGSDTPPVTFNTRYGRVTYG